MDATGIGLALSGVAFAALAVLVRGLQRQVAVLRERLAGVEAERGVLLGNLRALAAGSAGQAEQIARLQRELARLRDELGQAGAADDEGRIVNHAIRLARRGADAAELVEVCGLSETEAELIVRLHRARQDSD